MKKIKALLCDVDGTLTDNSLYYNKNGEELKRFSAKDGMGIVLLQKQGIAVWIISGISSKPVRARMKDLGVKEVHTGIDDKITLMKDLCKKHNVNLEEVAYMGDDINDLECMKIAGTTAVPNDAEDSVKEIADYTMQRNGGYGAVRDFCNMIIKNQGDGCFQNLL